MEEPETKRKFAVKAFLKSKINKENKGCELFYNEISLMKKVNHSAILKLQEVWETTNSYYFIIEFCQGGSLLDKII